MGNVRFTEKYSGVWEGNVFYSDALANRFLENMTKRVAPDEEFEDTLPSDCER